MRTCDHPDVPKPDKCAVCRRYVTDAKYRAWFDAYDPETCPVPSRLPEPMGDGPGTEMTEMLADMGAGYFKGCSCRSKARRMNEWGVEGCRKRRLQIAGWLHDAAKVATRGEIEFDDPVEAFLPLVDEAISRAEKKAKVQVTI